MFVRADVFRAVGGFDETFFLYYEDVDLCERIRRAGYSVLYTPLAEVSHPEVGHEKYHDRLRIGSYFAGLIHYFSKWHPEARALVRTVVLARLLTRALFWTGARMVGRIDRAGFRERIAGYRNAARAVLTADKGSPEPRASGRRAH
jgi:GT2 family glycosyltransferase